MFLSPDVGSDCGLFDYLEWKTLSHWPSYGPANYVFAATAEDREFLDGRWMDE